MKIHCCYFEDNYLENFHPLTLTRPVYDLRVGIFTLAEKWERTLENQSPVSGPLRGHLKGVFSEFEAQPVKGDILWLNPRFIPTQYLVQEVEKLDTGTGLMSGKQLIAARITRDMHESWFNDGISTGVLTIVDLPAGFISCVENIWELFQLNGEQIEHDIRLLQQRPVQNTGAFPHAVLLHPENIYIEEGAVIEPGAILLAEKGPIYIGKEAHVMANSIVRGPSAICEKSVIKMGAKIYEDSTIGPVCKVGGEISNVIFHSYSNKGHDGYAGNSVFGQWCNLGADTNTSNLKNNYGTVKVMDWKTKKESDTGQQFIGTIMGDHSKTGINSMLNTGTLCGVCCNLFSDGYPPKFVPSFSWVSGHNIVPYHFEKAVDAMERMMERRSVELTPAYRNMMKALFESTSF